MANQYAHHNKINVEQSTIDSMVSINTLTPTDTLTVGVRGQQWLFDSEKPGNIVLYGSLTQMADINTLFDSLTVADDSTVQDIFAQALSKITHGGSENNLQSVGVLKLATNAYIIIDNNHNKQFDAEDIVFSLGDTDIYEIAANLHYRAPTLELAGTPNPSVTELSLV